MNEHLTAKISGHCVANLGFGFLRRSTSCIPAVVRNSLLLRAIRRLVPENFSSNLLHPELIRGSLKKFLTGNFCANNSCFNGAQFLFGDVVQS